MARRRSTPYPRHRRTGQTKVKAEYEDEENMNKNLVKYRRQSNVVKPVPKRGREAFAGILNKEWELRGGEVCPANTHPYTVEVDNQTDDGCDSLRGSPSPNCSSPAPPAQPLPDLEYPDDSDIERQPSRHLRLFGLSTEDAILVARYLDWTPVVEASAVMPINTGTAGNGHNDLLEALAGHVVPDLETVLTEHQPREADTTEIGFIEPIVPLDLDIVFRYDGGVLHIEFPEV